MSAFGNLFSMESKTETNVFNTADSYNVSDTGNTVISDTKTLSGVLNTNVTIGGAQDLVKIVPWFFGAFAFVALFWLMGKN